VGSLSSAFSHAFRIGNIPCAAVGEGCSLPRFYFDFAGYSTMAVGLGCMFGLRIRKYFNSPNEALEPADFWRRWHISLSTCMRD